MSDEQPILAIVPARGGSKGVIRKNMRLLGGRPLIWHTLAAVASSGTADRVVVSSDDDEILQWAQLHGYEALPRPEALAADDATIAAVASHVADELDWHGIVAVYQPTSPLRTADSIRRAVEKFRAGDADSLMSVVRETHLLWYDEADDLRSARPLFAARVNRQFAKNRVVRENGAIQLIDAPVLRERRAMVGDRHVLFELPADEALDIDSLDDLEAARRRIEQATIVFRIRANAVVGSGHLYHCLQLAEELGDQRLRWLLVDCDPFVGELLTRRGYCFHHETSLKADLEELRGPGRNLVVNDVLDTTEAEVLVERSAGYMVVNVEDLGPGARLANWTVNALYPVDDLAHNVAYGSRWATLRGEFRDLPPKRVREDPERILITFGGTDPGGLAARFARLLHGAVEAEIVVIVGLGAALAEFPAGCAVRRHTKSMAAEMMEADLILTAAGRTVYEAAATGTPVVVVAQSAREATHAHLGLDTGTIFLGVAPLVDDTHVLAVVRRLLADYALRSELSERLRRSIDLLGGERIAGRLRDLLREG